MIPFTLDLYRHKGGTTVNNTSTYTPTEYELQLQKAQSKYADAIAPNALWLNDVARNLLQNSFGTVQVDYNDMNKKQQQQINEAQQGMANLTKGKLPQEYLNNMSAAIQSGLQNSQGKLINQLGNSGVLNSSVTGEALNDMSKNVSDTMANSYMNNISALSNLYGNQLNSATAGTTAAAANQEAAQSPAFNAWNASLGLGGATTGALAAAAGKGTTTSTQHQKSSGGLLSGLIGGIL